MVRCECFLQLIQAKTMQNTLPLAARTTDRYPTGREKIRAAGMKRRATTSNVAVPVYWVPVSF
jgi:hypothetical protein